MQLIMLSSDLFMHLSVLSWAKNKDYVRKWITQARYVKTFILLSHKALKCSRSSQSRGRSVVTAGFSFPLKIMRAIN